MVDMKQFDKHADAYKVIRDKVAYPDRLFAMMKARCAKLEVALDIGCGTGVSTATSPGTSIAKAAAATPSSCSKPSAASRPAPP
jgi:predicted TPR repeat methyltransferase